MEAFFLHYNSKKAPSEDSPEDESGLALSEKLRIGRQLAFAVVYELRRSRSRRYI